MSDAAVSLKKLARNRRFEELESGLLEAIEEGGVEREDLVAILNLATHRAEPAELDPLYWLALSSWAERHGAAEGLAAAREVAPLFPAAETIREDLVGWLAESHPDYPGAEGLARVVLTGSDLPLPEAFARADAILALPPGAYALKRNAKLPGRVVGLTESADALLLEDPDGEVAWPLAEAEKFAHLADDDYRSLALFEPERFAELATEGAAALVETVLRTSGPRLTYRDLRAHLVELLPMPWNEWWNDARPRLRRSAWIEMTASSQPTLELRRVPISHDAEIREELETAEGFTKLSVIVEFLDESGEHAATEPELIRHFAETLATLAAGDEAPLSLAALAVLEELRAVVPAALDGLETASPPTDRAPADLMAALGDARLEESTLEYVKAARPDDWPAFFAASLPVLTAEGADLATTALAAAGLDADIRAAAAEIMASPRRYPGALVWLWKYAGAGNLPPDAGGPDRGDLFAHLLGTLDRACRGMGAKSALAWMLQSAFTSQNFGIAKRTLAATDLAGARRIKEVLERSHSLTDTIRVKVQDLLAETHPKVYATDTPPWLREDLIWTTAEGLTKKRQEYGKLVNEKLPEIAAAVGRAASFGDLSENAEYTAALEERSRMTERANSLKADLDLAREIDPARTGGSVVTVGSRVLARRTDTGEERTFTFLGPWDVDTKAGIYSYRAPLSLAFMGRKPGETIGLTLDRVDQNWEILSVESALSAS